MGRSALSTTPASRRSHSVAPPPPNKALALRSGIDEMPESRSEEHTSELQSHVNLVCRLLLEKKKQHSRAPREAAEAAKGRLMLWRRGAAVVTLVSVPGAPVVTSAVDGCLLRPDAPTARAAKP